MRTLVMLVALCVVAACGRAQTPVGPHVRVENARYSPPLGGSGMGAGYMTIISSKDEAVIGVSSPLAAAIEIHETRIVDNRASMGRVAELKLPADQAVVFAPGGLHLMIHGPHLGDSDTAIPVIFQLQSGETLEVSFPIATQAPVAN